MITMFRSLAACAAVLSTVAAADAQSIDWAKVDGIFGRTGAVGGAVHRYGFPRTDLQVTLDSIRLHDEVINRAKRKLGKCPIAGPLLVRDNVIGDKEDFAWVAMLSRNPLCHSRDHSIRRREEREPELEDEQIRLVICGDCSRLHP